MKLNETSARLAVVNTAFHSALTIDQVTKELIDGLDLDFETTKHELTSLMAANQWSLKELNDFCWENSADIFDLIS